MVKVLYAVVRPPHRAKHLYVISSDSVVFGQSPCDKIHDFVLYAEIVVVVHHKEVRLHSVVLLWHLSLVHKVRIGDDMARSRLTEDTCEPHRRYHVRRNDVTKHVSCPNGRKLVYVTNKKKAHIGGYG